MQINLQFGKVELVKNSPFNFEISRFDCKWVICYHAMFKFSTLDPVHASNTVFTTRKHFIFKYSESKTVDTLAIIDKIKNIENVKNNRLITYSGHLSAK